MGSDGFESEGVVGCFVYVDPFGEVFAVETVVVFEDVVLWEYIGDWFYGIIF